MGLVNALHGQHSKLINLVNQKHVVPIVHLHLLLCCLQFTEICYLMYQGYYAYAAILQLISWAAIMILVNALHDQHSKLVNLVNQKHVVPIVQRGWVRAASSHQLVPGDVVVMQRGKAPCDMVLLRGTCLVEESMLSGEVYI